MPRKHGKPAARRRPSAWGLMALLLLALLGISLVNDPDEKLASADRAGQSPEAARYEMQSTTPYADRAYAVDMGAGDAALQSRPAEPPAANRYDER